jgi:effector-binding domain-containing protein
MITRPSNRTLSLNPWLLHSVLSRCAGQSHDTIGLMPILCRELAMPPQYFFSREQVLTTTNTSQHSIQTAMQSLNWINAALDELDNGQSPISVIVKRRPAVRIASIRVKLRNYAEVASFENELSDALPPECVGTLRGVLWHRCADSGSPEAEPFVELKKRAPLRGAYEMKELPQATLACAYSGIGDESAERAYVAVRRWIQIRGYRLAGPKREIYLQNMLEIQFPLDS